jgi:hypothetical protein
MNESCHDRSGQAGGQAGKRDGGKSHPHHHHLVIYLPNKGKDQTIPLPPATPRCTTSHSATVTTALLIISPPKQPPGCTPELDMPSPASCSSCSRACFCICCCFSHYCISCSFPPPCALRTLRRLILVPAPDLRQVAAHVDALGPHVHHPRVFEHAPRGCAAGLFLFEAGLS